MNSVVLSSAARLSVSTTSTAGAIRHPPAASDPREGRQGSTVGFPDGVPAPPHLHPVCKLQHSNGRGHLIQLAVEAARHHHVALETEIDGIAGTCDRVRITEGHQPALAGAERFRRVQADGDEQVLGDSLVPERGRSVDDNGPSRFPGKGGPFLGRERASETRYRHDGVDAEMVRGIVCDGRCQRPRRRIDVTKLNPVQRTACAVAGDV